MGRSVAAKAAVIAAAPRVLSAGRFAICETPAGELLVVLEQDGMAAAEFRLPRTLTTLIRKAAAGEDVSPASLLLALRGR